MLLSLSVRRAWIEILVGCPQGRWQPVALRKESVDRNDVLAISAVLELVSLSVRRAWIEITYVIRLPRVQVSLSVRRAWIEISLVGFGVCLVWSLSVRRAWIEMLMKCQAKKYSGSLSVRRAWIEIPSVHLQLIAFSVALRKESVDRNGDAGDCAAAETASLSVRRAWIEMVAFVFGFGAKLSLSVRRAWIEIA